MAYIYLLIFWAVMLGIIILANCFADSRDRIGRIGVWVLVGVVCAIILYFN